jgi:hypothetical protein
MVDRATSELAQQPIGERKALTIDQVAAAERGEITHPIISVLEQHLPALLRCSESYPDGTVNSERELEHIKPYYGPLADAFVDASPYTLGAVDVIAIWATLDRLAFDTNLGYARYLLAGMISSAYAIQGLDNPAWKKFPRHYVETGHLPDELQTDKEGLTHVLGKLREITAINDINTYRSSIMQSGNEASNISFLRGITENLSTGLTMVASRVDLTLMRLAKTNSTTTS